MGMRLFCVAEGGGDSVAQLRGEQKSERRQVYGLYASSQPRGSDELPAGCTAGAASNDASVPDMHATSVMLGAAAWPRIRKAVPKLETMHGLASRSKLHQFTCSKYGTRLPACASTWAQSVKLESSKKLLLGITRRVVPCPAAKSCNPQAHRYRLVAYSHQAQQHPPQV